MKAKATAKKAEPRTSSQRKQDPVFGNLAELIILQKKSTCACGGGCPSCLTNEYGVQTKLAISEPGDPYELEADRIADQVMSMSPDPEEQSERSADALENDIETILRKPAAQQNATQANIAPPSSQKGTDATRKGQANSNESATSSRTQNLNHGLKAPKPTLEEEEEADDPNAAAHAFGMAGKPSVANTFDLGRSVEQLARRG